MSKFSKVLEAAKDRNADSTKQNTPIVRGAADGAASRATATRAAQAEREREAIATPATTAARRGRPPGKRSDPDYEQTTAYIRKQTHLGVKIALLQEGKGREYSELVEELLAEWLRSRS